ncbi:MBL fold metallo-hydrolase [Leptospira ognonensis]|uniref:MBL fold metallo-hydrolase n=1 Tax=Leptospira ognonensis TaxID=2484945 RepID=A0A4R9K9U3_9LEPT|nr:MBL fold metallo-hydrolase [Leptospira ognonensis]TGL62306.1 MBL fold metallo-hydrolase [Leptospira ognonensis]
MKSPSLTILAFFLILHCSQSTRPFSKTVIGKTKSFEEIESSVTQKGPIKFQKFLAADWIADRSGLLDFKDPKTKSAGLVEGEEEIQIYFYIVEHPKFGKYLIDTGISNVFKKEPQDWPVSKLIQNVMNLDKLKIKSILSETLKDDQITLNGVFLTHMHLDHIMGVPDLPNQTTVYVGPDESNYKAFLNLFVQGSTDRLIGENVKIEQLEFKNKSPENIEILDFFGDGSLYVLWVSGHTPGSLAFLVQTTGGTQLIVGDTCHTTWGWEQNVPPGKFTSSLELNRKHLNQLKEITQKFPKIKIHPGHQSFK